jgi:predicted dehydrogenase
MNIGIIGCGLIGKKRASSVGVHDKIVAVSDIDINKAKSLANKLRCSYFKDYKDITLDKTIDIIIISTPNFMIKEIALNALRNKKHVLSEKPLGKNSEESKIIQECAIENKRILYTGFNHRFHPSIIRAKKLIDKNLIGDVIHMHGHYGHGGRPGMESEWRSKKTLSGGGELLDQGVHLIDLAIFFQGFPKRVYGLTSNLAWDIEVEDSSSFILHHKDNKNSLFSVGWIYWKNKFELSIYGYLGYIIISGLGGSYGNEKLTLGIRNLKGGKPMTKTFYFDNEDHSWRKEWKYFKKIIKNNNYTENGLQANLVIDAIYKSNSSKSEIKL